MPTVSDLVPVEEQEEEEEPVKDKGTRFPPITLRWQTEDKIPADVKSALSRFNNVQSLGTTVPIDPSISLVDQATMWVTVNKVINMPDNGVEWTNAKKNAFRRKILRIMNKRGTIQLDVEDILIKTIEAGGLRRLLSDSVDVTIEATVSGNDAEVNDFLNDLADNPITDEEIAEELNDSTDADSAEFSDLTIDSTTVSSEEESLTVEVITYYDENNEAMATYTPGDDLPEGAELTSAPEPTSPNNANDPEGNGYEPTTKARIIGNIKRRRNPYDGEAKSVDEVKNIIRDLITNNPKRAQWPIAKKVAFAKKIKKKYLKN